jgi:hypothetical protein
MISKADIAVTAAYDAFLADIPDVNHSTGHVDSPRQQHRGKKQKYHSQDQIEQHV